MKRYKLILAFLPFFIFAQNYDPETGEIIEGSVGLNYQNFNDSYNNMRKVSFVGCGISFPILLLVIMHHY